MPRKKKHAQDEARMDRRPDLDPKVIRMSLMNRALVRARRAEALAAADRRGWKPLTNDERSAHWEDFSELDSSNGSPSLEDDELWEEFEEDDWEEFA